MEQDTRLKNILLNSAEGASSDFTDVVMKRVYGNLAAPPYYKPLVNPKFKKGFIFAFGVIVATILSLCLVIALANFKVIGWIQSIPLPDLNYNKLLLFIFIFWILFTLNRQFQKSFQLNKDRGTFKHHE
jgi:hypothetical protein